MGTSVNNKYRVFTSLEQSKKLAEILPIESADMYWWSTSLRHYIEAMDDGDFNEEEGHVRAWSLTALLSVLPNGIGLFKTVDGEFCCLSNDYMTKNYDNPVDACYEMILKLNELN